MLSTSMWQYKNVSEDPAIWDVAFLWSFFPVPALLSNPLFPIAMVLYRKKFNILAFESLINSLAY